ncbi:hypothetical protein PR048_013633 [Dryococelus australis]|uniref:Uncharacterized protein n=1 Tax=Dryococelus australis TaxID=614101 RepID=A0ABQ9HSQ9_9NEOP|nr:hypothetical protein PR048_013633 [Dryococelus australis]
MNGTVNGKASMPCELSIFRADMGLFGVNRSVEASVVLIIGVSRADESAVKRAALSGSIPMCKIPELTFPGTEPSLSWWETTALAADTPQSRVCIEIHGCTVRWLVRSPLSKAILVRSPAGSLTDFRMWESCWIMQLEGGFFRGMTGTYVSRLESPSLGTCCLALGQTTT